ncbi:MULTISPECIES: enoyl-CoA hydratase-related protein [unclassified Brevibacterium]|uniref:enoyl-CoA hydratase-related protein n=1 Tax=unclassified Brevibacterium TaxID=2614124 RepID=UPI001E462E97|nr:MULTISPECIES: enoyl-CoA hydratase-related protein [unclassified Brevibacterium]MCD1285461.1 enoyl-CoA hydratase [Brevibacterium sp. CCUG 69071]MDK8434510.1 enoyl-CoA hydratase-related protein [Brevibacterium sp. H-BE7]
MTSSILTESHDGIITVTINRPESLNALTAESIAGLRDALAAAGSARALILTGNDRSFSSGADLQGSVQDGGLGLDEANRVIRSLIDLPIPTIAAVSGPAAGIGCSLALACDYTVMSEESYLMLAFTKIGLMPDGGATALVAASAGRHRALKMALTAQKVWAREALDWGLASEVTPAGTQLTRARELAGAWAQGAPLAFAASKEAINQATLTELDGAFDRELDGQTRLRASADFAEGVAAFIEKRGPKFTGR